MAQASSSTELAAEAADSGSAALGDKIIPPSQQVLHNPDLFTHILTHIHDQTTWRNVFTVEKAWLPALTSYRCRTASWEVMKWKRDSYWHDLVMDSVRVIRLIQVRRDESLATLVPTLSRQVEAAFERFPRLRRVDRTDLQEDTYCPKAWIRWDVDRAANRWGLAVHQPLEQDCENCDDNDDTDDNDDSEVDSGPESTPPLSDRWDVTQTAALVFTNWDSENAFDGGTHGVLKNLIRRNTLGEHISAVDLEYCPCRLSDLARLCVRRLASRRKPYIERIEGSMINELTVEGFSRLGKAAGTHLRHVHLSRCANDEWMAYVGGVSSELVFNDIHLMIASVRSFYPVLETLTISLEQDLIDPDEDLTVLNREHIGDPGGMTDILLLLRGRSINDDEETNAREAPRLPVLGLARNLAFIADRSTDIKIKHWNDYEEEWSELEDEARSIMGVIGFIRSLPESHIKWLLTMNLDESGIEPGDHNAFMQLKFRKNGEPIPRKLTLAKERFLTVRRAWADANEWPHEDAENEILDRRDQLEEAGENVPRMNTHRCRASKMACQARKKTLKEAEAEIARLRKEVRELRSHPMRD